MATLDTICVSALPDCSAAVDGVDMIDSELTLDSEPSSSLSPHAATTSNNPTALRHIRALRLTPPPLRNPSAA